MGGDTSETDPSRVIHFRNLGHDVTDADIMAFAQSYGPVEALIMLRDKKQALLQMKDLASARQLVEQNSPGQATIREKRVYLKYSRHQELSGSKSTPSSNKILLVTFLNPHVPVHTSAVTCEVVYQVFGPYGDIHKIVIVQKEKLQALVQYDSDTSAASSKKLLQGQTVTIANQPAGSSVQFSLDIQYSNLNDLIVKKNSDKSIDYTGGCGPITAPMITAVHQQLQQQIPTQPQQVQDGYGMDLSQAALMYGTAQPQLATTPPVKPSPPPLTATPVSLPQPPLPDEEEPPQPDTSYRMVMQIPATTSTHTTTYMPTTTAYPSAPVPDVGYPLPDEDGVPTPDNGPEEFDVPTPDDGAQQEPVTAFQPAPVGYGSSSAYIPAKRTLPSDHGAAKRQRR